jgi:hypothetical protein
MDIFIPFGAQAEAAGRIREAVELGITDRDFELLVEQVLRDLDINIIGAGVLRTEVSQLSGQTNK